MEYHPVVNKIKAILNDNSVLFETFEHEPVRTSEDAAKLRHGYTLKQGAKSLIVKVKEPGKGKRFAMLVVPADKKFDTDKIKNKLNLTDIRFATEQEVLEITDGILLGGVPPFGRLFGLDVFVDRELFDNERIVFNAGDRSYSVAMKASDYAKLFSMVVEDIAS